MHLQAWEFRDHSSLRVSPWHHAIVGDKDLLNHHAARAGALHPDHIPVVENPEVIAIKQNPSKTRGRRRVRACEKRHPEEMRADVAPRRIIPSALDAVP